MAYIGLAIPTVAALDEENNTYTGAFRIGKAIQIDITPNYAEGSLYGDDVKAEYDKEFSFAETVLNTTTLPKEAHTLMFGHKSEEDTVKYCGEDEAKYVGLGFRVVEKISGVRKYVGVWLPKVKFTEGAASYKTKGDAIEYQTPNISGQAVQNKEGVWKETKVFDNEADALKWINEKAGNTETPAAKAAKGVK